MASTMQYSSAEYQAANSMMLLLNSTEAQQQQQQQQQQQHELQQSPLHKAVLGTGANNTAPT